MRQPNLDAVEIVEPPIGELTKKRLSLKRSCLAGCGCLFLVIIGGLISLRLFIGPGPQTLRAVPANFPSTIPVYDKDAIDTITYLPGRYKSRGTALAAFFPKLLLSPLFLKTTENAPPLSAPSQNPAGAASQLWAIVTAPANDSPDTVRVEWRNLNAEPGFIISYYENELKKQGYAITEPTPAPVTEFSFNLSGTASGTLSIADDSAKPGTDYAVLTVDLP